MTTSAFDVENFMNLTVEGENSTKREPCPEGEYMGIIKKVDIRPWQSKDGSKSGLTLDVTWDIDDQGVKEALGKTEVTVRQGIMLDLTEQSGLDMGKGKNVSLGRLREAVNMNVPGQAFSFAALPGAGPAKVKVTHRVDGEDVYDEIRSVAKFA